MLTTRRKFVAVSAAAMTSSQFNHATGPGDTIRIGLIGPGGMGSNHLRALVARQDVQVSWICEVDKARLAQAAAEVGKTGREPKTTKDMRHVFGDKEVDAVLIATPDHWHTPAAILALDAGKHVYVEKPCSHNIREGKLLVEAAKRSGRVLQVGTQSRSAPHLQEAMAKLKGGAIGEVLCAKAWNSQKRGNIGKTKPAKPPENLDFEMWQGPAPRGPYRTNMLPSIWRWWKAYGCGDIGNDGVHELDIALWGLGVTTHPERIQGAGGKYFFEDDQQFADQMYCSFEWNPNGTPLKRKMLVYEQRDWSPYVQEGHENGNAWYGTKGMLVLGKASGWTLFGERNKKLAERSGKIDIKPHHDNFFEAIRGKAKANAPAEVGHLAATIAHLGNLSVALGRTLEFDAKAEKFSRDREADALVGRTYEPGHWAVPRG